MTIQPGISVIICVYTEMRWNEIVAAVRSVQQQSQPPHEIILVVDHNPALLERVQSQIPGVITVANCEPQGLSGARNSGIAAASGALITFLDDDAIAEPDWLERLYRCCEDPQVLGAGGSVEPLWSEKRPPWFPEEFYWVVGCSYQRQLEKPVKVRNPFGGCACYRRELFTAVGGFRHDMGRVGTLPMGCEETELCIRAQQHWPQRFFLYEPNAKIHHCVPAKRATWRYFSSRCYAEGLSKAAVARYVGAKDGLSTERDYVLHALLRGLVRAMRQGIIHLDGSGFAKAGALVAGLMMTTMGYLVGTVSLRLTALKRKDAHVAEPAQQL
jgi:GT2 family glycosyltransferase